MGANCVGMKTLYEKASNLANYIRDIMYMQRYWMDIYSDVAKFRTTRVSFVPPSYNETIRGYEFFTTNPEIEDGKIHQSICRKSDYRADYVMTLTSSYSHIRSNTGDKAKYHYVQHAYISPNDFEYILSGELLDLFKSLRNGISTDTIRETEFQQTMIHKDYVITGFYLLFFLIDDLNNIQYSDKVLHLCLGYTDIRAFVPARKAIIDLLNKKTNHDWRQAIFERYGHTIGC